MRAGDRVLIHSASGGVGLAAMQLAKIAGATVFATAGNDEKRDYVRNLGAAEVMDSRSLTFAEQTLQATAGEGVDIILNSLPGEAITKGLSILKTGGRFLEIGKRDIYADAPLVCIRSAITWRCLRSTWINCSSNSRERMGKMLGELVVRDSNRANLQPLPTKTTKPMRRAAAYPIHAAGKTHRQNRRRLSNKRPRTCCRALQCDRVPQ